MSPDLWWMWGAQSKLFGTQEPSALIKLPLSRRSSHFGPYAVQRACTVYSARVNTRINKPATPGSSGNGKGKK